MFIVVTPCGLAYSWVFVPENFLHISMKIHITLKYEIICVRAHESMKYLKRGESRASWSNASKRVILSFGFES